MIPTEIYRLACAIGQCGDDDEPDNECIKIAWELAAYLKNDGYHLVKIAPQTAQPA